MLPTLKCCLDILKPKWLFYTYSQLSDLLKIIITTSDCTPRTQITCAISSVCKKCDKSLDIWSVIFCLQVRLTGQVTTLWAQPAPHWLSTRLHHSLWSPPSNHSCRLCLRETGTPTTALLSRSTPTSKTCVSLNITNISFCITGGHFCSTQTAVPYLHIIIFSIQTVMHFVIITLNGKHQPQTSPQTSRIIRLIQTNNVTSPIHLECGQRGQAAAVRTM